VSANFQTGLAPFTNPGGGCFISTFEGSVGNGASCIGSATLSVEIDARRFSDLIFTYRRGTFDYGPDELFGVSPANDFPIEGFFGSSPLTLKIVDTDRRFEDSRFTLNVQSTVQALGGLDFDFSMFDEFEVTAIPAVDDTCDNRDQDGDVTRDEDFAGPPTQCGVGACFNEVPLRCRDGVFRDACVPKPAAPNDSTCNGIDDDCDNRIDEDCPTGSPYRTMIVIGDTQSLAYPTTIGPLREIVDWITTNLDKDNIDAVIQVGDLIENGQIAKANSFTLGCGPTRQTECGGTIPDITSHAGCRIAGSTDARLPVPCGCFEEVPGVADNPRSLKKAGYSCGQLVRDVDREWDLIRTELVRLNRVVPVVAVRGNHDNPNGNDFLGGPRAVNQPRGLRDYFGPAFYDEQASRFTSGTRQFRVLAYGNKLLANAFRFKIGGRQDVNVITLDDFQNSAVPVGQQLLSANPNVPTILLGHNGLYRPGPTVPTPDSFFWKAFIEPQPGAPGPLARQIFMVAQGHINQNTHEDITLPGGVRILRTVIDNQVAAPTLPAEPVLRFPDATFMSAVRFYLDSNQVEIVTVNARDNKVITGGTFGLTRRSFTFPRP
jgi:hypothetical protein